MIFGKDKYRNYDGYDNGDIRQNNSTWDKSRCRPFNRGGGCESGNIEPYVIGLPEVPNIVSITNMLSMTANIKIETPRTHIDYYNIYVSEYTLGGVPTKNKYMFKTTELSPNIPTQVFKESYVYEIYAISVNETGESGKSNVVKVDTQKNKITEYPQKWIPAGEVTEILCDIGIGCDDILVCN